jgi:hypothetical protein
MIDNPIFVVGSARSGTNFLGQVLKRHPDVHCLLERPVVFDYASQIALHPDFKRERPAEVRNELRRRYAEGWRLGFGSCRNCSKLCRKSATLADWNPWGRCHRGRVARYADKSHQHVLNVDVLLSAFPRAQFLHIVRDGLDVVSSMLRHEGVMSWFAEKHINGSTQWPQPWFGVESIDHFREWSTFSPARKCGLRYASWVRAGMEAAERVPTDQWLDLRYEELVTEPQREGAALFAFLGLPPHPEALADADASSVGSWRQRLSSNEVRDAVAGMKDTMHELGYATASP